MNPSSSSMNSTRVIDSDAVHNFVASLKNGVPVAALLFRFNSFYPMRKEAFAINGPPVASSVGRVKCFLRSAQARLSSPSAGV